MGTTWVFGDKGVPKNLVRYFNEVYFDLGDDCWVNVYAGIDDTNVKLLTKKPDMNLLFMCAR